MPMMTMNTIPIDIRRVYRVDRLSLSRHHQLVTTMKKTYTHSRRKGLRSHKKGPLHLRHLENKHLHQPESLFLRYQVDQHPDNLRMCKEHRLPQRGQVISIEYPWIQDLSQMTSTLGRAACGGHNQIALLRCFKAERISSTKLKSQRLQSVAANQQQQEISMSSSKTILKP